MSIDIEKSVNVVYDRFINQKDTSGTYICPFAECGKKYRTKESLARHLNRHSTVKQHVCEICGKSFLRKSEREIHQRVHTGIKPFACTLCDKRFARATDLKIHMIYHSDDKPYSCPFEGCTLRFKRKSDAKKHLRIHIRKTQGNISSLMRNHMSAFTYVPSSQITIDKQNSITYINN